MEVPDEIWQKIRNGTSMKPRNQLSHQFLSGCRPPAAAVKNWSGIRYMSLTDKPTWAGRATNSSLILLHVQWVGWEVKTCVDSCSLSLTGKKYRTGRILSFFLIVCARSFLACLKTVSEASGILSYGRLTVIFFLILAGLTRIPNASITRPGQDRSERKRKK